MNYNKSLKFEWNEAKSNACFRERGFDFSYAANAIADPNRIIEQDTRYNYGEDRFRLIGMVEGRLFVVVYTPRANGVTRMISARKANQREAKQYENNARQDQS